MLLGMMLLFKYLPHASEDIIYRICGKEWNIDYDKKAEGQWTQGFP